VQVIENSSILRVPVDNFFSPNNTKVEEDDNDIAKTIEKIKMAILKQPKKKVNKVKKIKQPEKVKEDLSQTIADAILNQIKTNEQPKNNSSQTIN
jgi:hypothetical protein